MSTNIETTEFQSALEALMVLAGIPVNEPGAVSVVELKQAITVLQAKLQHHAQAGHVVSGQSSAAGVVSQLASLSHSMGSANVKHKNVLIAGQLGIITHQLKQSLHKHQAEVAIANDVNDTIGEFKKRDFDLVIIDLLMPTEREGLLVLEETQRLAKVCNLATHFAVLIPQSKDKQLKEVCKQKGASVIIDKIEGWQNAVVGYFLGREI